MSAHEKFRISGKKQEFPSTGLPRVKWTVRPGGWLVGEREDGSRVRMMLHESRGQLGVAIGGRLYQGQVAADAHGGHGGAGGGDADLVAQFPGKVRKILVAPDAEVAEGMPLLLVEAMKMEFTIKAPFAGKVSKILVKEGQQLSPGDRFVELEELAGIAESEESAGSKGKGKA